jgi:HlyD family secretion protein
VALQVKVPERLAIPEEGIVLRKGQPYAAVLQGGKVRFQALRLGEDAGQSVRILEGLRDGEVVVLNPPADLKDGDRVQTAGSPS